MHFPLHPDTPAEGMKLLDLFGGPSAAPRLEQSRQRLLDLAKQEGLPMSGNREMTYNSRLAQELGVWAEELGHGTEFHDAAFRAYFVENQNVGDVDVLVGIAKSVGLDAGAARKVLTERTHREKVDSDWSRSRQSGVNAVPTFQIGGKMVVGAQPYEVLEELAIEAGAKKRQK